LGVLQDSLKRIQQRPAAFRVVEPSGTRKALLDVFPYAVFFLAEHSTIVIVAVAHAKRRPNYWKERLDQK
jgi:toxin ParE1/3/4